MSGEGIAELGRRLISECLAVGPEREDSEMLESQTGALPFVFSLTEEGRPIQLVYHCSDVCPDQGGVSIFFHDTTKRECCDLKQVPRHDFAWGGYLGCIPREVASNSLIERNPCAKLDRSGPDPQRYPVKKRKTLASPYTLQFPGGKAVITWTETQDHVVITDTDGKLLSDSVCAYPPGYDSHKWVFGYVQSSFWPENNRSEAMRKVMPKLMAKVIHFPLRVNGGTIQVIANEDEFIARFDKIFTPTVIKKLLKTESPILTCHEGTQAHLGEGVLWTDLYDGQARVNVINQSQ